MLFFTRRMIEAAAVAVHGRPVMPLLDESGAVVLTGLSRGVAGRRGLRGDVGGGWRAGRDRHRSGRVLLAINVATRAVRDGWGPGYGDRGLYDELVERQTVRPTFYVDFDRPHRLPRHIATSRVWWSAGIWWPAAWSWAPRVRTH